MFESQKNTKNLIEKCPWNLLPAKKKTNTKLLKSKMQGIPKKIVKENKKLYMKERWITKRLYNFIQEKLKPK